MTNTSRIFLAVTLTLSAVHAFAQSDSPYKVQDTVQLMGTGGIDYVYADSAGRKLYIPRGQSTQVFDLDTHKALTPIDGIGGHGIAVDPASHHGISSSGPLGMFDTETMKKIKTIDVAGRPDGILFEPFTSRVFVFSHQSPSVNVIDPKDGTVAGTIDIGGAIEQAQSDGAGKVYADIEDQKKIAVLDVKTMKVLSRIDLGSTAGEPGGLGFDAKNHILFAMCANPSVCVIASADDGKILATLPIGNGTDSGGFNPATMEAFSSNRDGTLTIIKESSPTSFAVEQNVTTKMGCKTSTLDSRTNTIITACTERIAPPPGSTPTPAPSPSGSPGERRRGGFGGRGGPGNLDVLFVGR